MKGLYLEPDEPLVEIPTWMDTSIPDLKLPYTGEQHGSATIRTIRPITGTDPKVSGDEVSRDTPHGGVTTRKGSRSDISDEEWDSFGR